MTTGTCQKTAVRRPRRYLSSVERKREILDAALIEFTNHGYAATTIERIAMRAGLSKAGIYAHYKSKEEIFEDLLAALVPPDDPGGMPPLEAGVPLVAVVDTYIDRLYARLENPVIVSTFQMLIAESRRSPELVRRWYDEVVESRVAKDQSLVNEYVRRGVMRGSALTDNFSLAASPLVHWMILRMVCQYDLPMSLEQAREAHRQLLLDALQPR
ncbi:TetR/AcrR family transcriptional regulator [Pseudothauera rhizosphaerae]|uniref:TetR/AcrR family transcriptional regulator n=1 Tax=Pseudothauera rhizosphaerae TaxID=2565932 RepID=UPI001454CCEE|nr:TetR/AcrR family transcriptional regulator [Pseudothauera rhizosphaerae]